MKEPTSECQLCGRPMHANERKPINLLGESHLSIRHVCDPCEGNAIRTGAAIRHVSYGIGVQTFTVTSRDGFIPEETYERIAKLAGLANASEVRMQMIHSSQASRYDHLDRWTHTFGYSNY